LLPGEKQAEYAMIAARIVNASGPQDAIEEFLVRDVVDLTWEILRLRRSKAGILRSSMGDGVGNFLCDVGLNSEGHELGESWAAGDNGARKKVDAILARAGLTIDEVTARTLESKLDSFERLDRMLASAEARRNNALREIDRHRAALGGTVRQSLEEIQDAEFRNVETGEDTARE
jgi:protein-tyrosine-phosphatase